MIELLIIILEQSLMHIPLIIGAYISIGFMKIPDLSIESAYLFGAMAGASSLTYTQHMPQAFQLIAALIASIIGGGCVGLVSASLTRLLRLPHLLSSIITFGIFHGLMQTLFGFYRSLGHASNPLALFSYIQRHPELPILLLIGMIVCSSMHYFVRTQLGYALAAYGNNPHFLEKHSISTSYVFLAGVIISNALAGMGGYLFAQSNGFVDMSLGAGRVLLAITTLVLGTALISTFIGKRTFLIPLSGISAYFTLQQLLLKAGFHASYFTTVQALVVLLCVLIYYRTNHQEVNHLGI